MYRILVFSDSHGNIEYMKKAIDGIRDISVIVHLGDLTRDINEVMREYPDYRYEIVKGNCDFASIEDDERIFELGGYKFLITHGHKFGVKTGTDYLMEYAEEKGVDCVMYGHTHISECEFDRGLLVMNPGCGSLYRESYGVVEIEDEIKADIIEMRGAL